MSQQQPVSEPSTAGAEIQESKLEREQGSSLLLLQEGEPLPGVGSHLTLGNELSEETHVLTNQEILLRKGAWAESSGVREPRRTPLPCLRFLVMRLVSRLSLVSHSDSGPLLVVHTALSQDGCQRGF